MRNRSRNCSNLQEIISSRFVDKWEESGELRSRLVSRGTDPTSTLCCYTLRSWRRNWHKTWKWQWRTFLELFFILCWRNISLSRRQLSTINQVLCGRSRDTCTEKSVRHGGGKITWRKRCWNWVSSAWSLNQLSREEGSDTQRHDHCGCACGRSPECWEAKTSRQLLCANGEDVETQASGVH